MLKSMFSFLISFVGLFIFWGWSSPNVQQEIVSAYPKNQTDYSLGKVVTNNTNRNYPDETFALYLPTSYEKSKPLPVFFFLDPQADGEIPVRKYSVLAEHYKVILIGSNNCKNAIPILQSMVYLQHLIENAQKEFSIDKNSIGICGFSGGAKVATAFSISTDIASVLVYTGAVIPVDHFPSSLILLGIAGERDMNFTDLVQFDMAIPSSSPHRLLQWDGKHEWPNRIVFSDAFLALKEKSIIHLKGHSTVFSISSLQTEQEEKQLLFNSLLDKDSAWWKAKIRDLNSKKSTNPMYERLLGFVSLACYTLAGNAMQQNNLITAKKIISIYLMTDPKNQDAKKFEDLLKQKLP